MNSKHLHFYSLALTLIASICLSGCDEITNEYNDLEYRCGADATENLSWVKVLNPDGEPHGKAFLEAQLPKDSSTTPRISSKGCVGTPDTSEVFIRSAAGPWAGRLTNDSRSSTFTLENIAQEAISLSCENIKKRHNFQFEPRKVFNTNSKRLDGYRYSYLLKDKAGKTLLSESLLPLLSKSSQVKAIPSLNSSNFLLTVTGHNLWTGRLLTKTCELIIDQHPPLRVSSIIHNSKTITHMGSSYQRISSDINIEIRSEDSDLERIEYCLLPLSEPVPNQPWADMQTNCSENELRVYDGNFSFVKAGAYWQLNYRGIDKTGNVGPWLKPVKINYYNKADIDIAKGLSVEARLQLEANDVLGTYDASIAALKSYKYYKKLQTETERIDLLAETQSALIRASYQPFHLVESIPFSGRQGIYSHDGETLFLLKREQGKNTISVISHLGTEYIPLKSNEYPNKMAVSPDDQHLVIAFGDGPVEVIYSPNKKFQVNNRKLVQNLWQAHSKRIIGLGFQALDPSSLESDSAPFPYQLITASDDGRVIAWPSLTEGPDSFSIYEAGDENKSWGLSIESTPSALFIDQKTDQVLLGTNDGYAILLSPSSKILGTYQVSDEINTSVASECGPDGCTSEVYKTKDSVTAIAVYRDANGNDFFASTRKKGTLKFKNIIESTTDLVSIDDKSTVDEFILDSKRNVLWGRSLFSGTLHSWHLQGKKDLKLLNLENKSYDFAINPDANRLATFNGETTRLWSMASHQLSSRKVIFPETSENTHDDSIYDIKNIGKNWHFMSYNSRRAILGFNDLDPQVNLDPIASTRRLILGRDGHFYVNSDEGKLLQSPSANLDETKFISNTDEYWDFDVNARGTVILWNRATIKVLSDNKETLIKNPNGKSIKLAYLSDNQNYLAFGDTEGHLFLYDLEQELWLIEGLKQKQLRDIIFTRSHEHMLTISSNGVIRKWLLPSGILISEQDHGKSGGDLYLDPSERILASRGRSNGEGKKTIRLWNLMDLKPIATFDQAMNGYGPNDDNHAVLASGVAFNRQSRQMITAPLDPTVDGGSAIRWQLEPKALAKFLCDQLSLAFESSDGENKELCADDN